MRFMVLVKASKESEAGQLPSAELLAKMTEFNEQLIKAGVLLAGDGLQASSKGARVRFSGTARAVVDGPFAETKELIAGYWIWQCKSLQEAIGWVKRCPNPHEGESEIEIRQVFEAADFGAEFPPGLREQEAAQRAEVLGLRRPRFEDGRALRIAGINQSYTVENRMQIPAQWQRFVPHMGRIAGQVDAYAYGVCWNDKLGFDFDYLCGVEVRDAGTLPRGFVTLELPPQRYAVFDHSGHISNIANTIDAIWSKWVPTSGLQAAKAPCFERYTPAFDPLKGMGGIELWIPVHV
jgi:predicted transcriptional regulator YdeE